MRQEFFKGLTEDQITKVKACSCTSDLLQLAKDEGFELTEEQLEAVNGGFLIRLPDCPKCKSSDVDFLVGPGMYHCNSCDLYFD